MSLITGLGVTAIFTSSQISAAENPTVAVLGIEAGEGVPDTVAVAATDAIRQRMSLSPGYRLVQGRDLVEVKLVFSCPDEAPPCMGQAAKSLGAGRLIFGSVKKVGADAYSITVKLFDGEKEAVESWTSDQFSRAQASSPALRGPAQKWIATLTGQSLPGTLHILGGVVGASVDMDGVGAGVMNEGGLTLSNVAPGKHEITLTKPGYMPSKKSVSLGSGDSRDVAIEMVAEAAAQAHVPVAPPSDRPVTETVLVEQPTSTGSGRLGFRVAAWLTLAGGVAGIAVGIRYSLLVGRANTLLDPYRRFACANTKRIECDLSGKYWDPATDQALQDSTKIWMKETKSKADKYQTYQWIGYGVGGALLATSAIFFYRGYVSHSSGATADARGSSFHFTPIFAPDVVGAAAFTSF
jgi:hypothetical protein